MENAELLTLSVTSCNTEGFQERRVFYPDSGTENGEFSTLRPPFSQPKPLHDRNRSPAFWTMAWFALPHSADAIGYTVFVPMSPACVDLAGLPPEWSAKRRANGSRQKRHSANASHWHNDDRSVNL